MITLLFLFILAVFLVTMHQQGVFRVMYPKVRELKRAYLRVIDTMNNPPKMNEMWTHKGRSVKILLVLDDGAVNWKYEDEHKSQLSTFREWLKLSAEGMERVNEE